MFWFRCRVCVTTCVTTGLNPQSLRHHDDTIRRTTRGAVLGWSALSLRLQELRVPLWLDGAIWLGEAVDDAGGTERDQ